MSDMPLKPVRPEPGHDDRVRRIVSRARREVATRDLLTFGLGRAWAGVVGLGSVVMSLVMRFTGSAPSDRSRTRKPRGGTE